VYSAFYGGGSRNLRKGAGLSLSLSSSLLLSLSPFPLCPPLKVGPLNQLEGLKNAVSSPSGVRGRSPAENEFGAL